MEVRRGYKHTEIGVIPEDWDVKLLDKIGQFSKGQGIRKDEASSGTIPCIRYGEIYTLHNDIIREYGSYISPQVAMNSKRLLKGDILFAGSGETKEEIGKAVAFIDDGEVYAGGDIVILRPDSACSEFLGYLFNSHVVVKQKASKGQGDAVVHINSTSLGEVIIPFPPIFEQSAIAEVLSDMDALLESLDRLINKKKDLKQAAMQQLLTGKTRLPGFNGEWEVKPIKDIVSIPISDGPHLTPKFLNDGIPFLSVNNLVDNKIDFSSLRFISRNDHDEFSKKCRPQRGDVLFGKAASVGQVALIDTDIELNIWSPLALIRFGRKVIAKFVVFVLQTRNIYQQIKLLTNSSSQGNIGMSDIGRIEIPVPSVPEQTAIASVLTDMDTELAELQAQCDKTRNLKQAMMQELLTGKTRLVPAGGAHG